MAQKLQAKLIWHTVKCRQNKHLPEDVLDYHLPIFEKQLNAFLDTIDPKDVVSIESTSFSFGPDGRWMFAMAPIYYKVNV